jgi:spermidine/putrescine transport system ATP-binding protein
MPSPHSVEILGLTKRFGETAAVDAVSLDIRKGEFFSLLGPSGCGKTTLLRMIGGFEEPTAGSIVIDGRDMTRTPPFARPVNMVFQHYALFPHLSVAENVAFGMRYKGIERSREKSAVAEALGLLQLEGFEKRRPHELSGGQRQRVALARALALRPSVLLLDEPLGALDQKLRKEVQVQLKQLQREVGITFVFVTHDQEEAVTMSDRIAVMNGGRVEQVGDASRVFETPETEFVARFMGASNFFAARVRSASGEALTLALADGREVRIAAGGSGLRPDDPVRFVVRPEKLELRESDPSPGGEVSMAVTVEDRVYQGISTVWLVRDDAGERFAVYEQNEKSLEEGCRFEPGGRAFLCWDPRHVVLLKGSRDGARA